MDDALQIGQRLARGVSRHLVQLGLHSIIEFVPTKGLRLDIIALNPKGEIWIVECKSSKADFQSDHKWQKYLDWCDRFYWAVPINFPIELLPQDTGYLLADPYGAEIMRETPKLNLSSARRKKITLKIARDASLRLQNQMDPKLE